MQTIGIVPTSGKDASVELVGKGRNLASETAIRKVIPDHPPTMANIVKELYQEQGVRGFFKGVSLNYVKGPISLGISFTAFDVIQSFLETDTERLRRLPRLNTTAS
jgi:Mitochondrial carrier protein